MIAELRPHRRITNLLEAPPAPALHRPRPRIIPGRVELPPEFRGVKMPADPDRPRYIDLSGLPAPPWDRLRREYDRSYGFCAPTVLEGQDATQPLRGYPRWRFQMHADRSLAQWTEGGNLLTCGIDWLRLRETPAERAAVPSVYLTDRPTSEFRIQRPGPCCDPETLTRRGVLEYECPVCGFLLIVPSGGAGQTFWMATNGSDGNNGSQAFPFQSFGRMIQALTAGDIGNVNNGTYAQTCVFNGAAGTAAQPIVLQAVNERQAIVSWTSGTASTIQMFRSFCQIVGLASENGDNNAHHDDGYCIIIAGLSSGTTGCQVRRCLVRRNNRGPDTNVQLIGSYGRQHLIYETEGYEHNRYIDYIDGENCHQVRCYVNQRGVPKTSGGGPTLGWYFYTGQDHLGENNIVEGTTDSGFGCQGQYRFNRRNRFLGNLCRAAGGKSVEIASSEGLGGGAGAPNWPIDQVLENTFSLQTTLALQIQDAQNTINRQFTAQGNARSLDAGGWGADGAQCSVTYLTSHFTGNLDISGQGGGATVRFVNARGGFSLQGGTVQQGNTTALNTPGGVVRPWTEDGSALRNAGMVGTVWDTGAKADNIGCDILYSYENGQLAAASVPLWSQQDGQWLLRGATLPGWNTVAGSSMQDLHTRFNVDPLLFPAGYGGGVGNSIPGLNSIWDAASFPLQFGGADSLVELGIRFRPLSSGQIVALRFYKHQSNTGTHVGKLYDNAGTLLASVTFTGETTSGWQQMTLPTPIAVVGGQTYMVAYTTTVGFYGFDTGYFATQGFAGTTVEALQNGLDGFNGAYHYGGGFPDTDAGGTNYWVDVLFALTGAGARSFNGVDQAEQSAANVNLSGTAKITVSIWARRDS